MASNHLVEQLPQRVGEEEELLLGQLVQSFPQHLVEQEPLLGQVEEQLPQHLAEQYPLNGRGKVVGQFPQHLVEQDPLNGRGQIVEQFPHHLVEQEPLLGPLLTAQRPNTEVFSSTIVPSSQQSHKFLFSRWFTL